MALGNTNISLLAVRNYIGSSLYSLFGIGTSALINKWSKYKPVRGAYPASGGNYGLDYANLWAYLQPRGGSPGGSPDEPVRLGDFRLYEHDKTQTLPPAYMNSAICALSDNEAMHPISNGDLSGMISLNAARVSEITLANLGLSGYYFGVYIRQTSHGQYWFKTLSTPAASNQWINVKVSMATLGVYDDFPASVDDSDDFEVMFILSSQIRATWSNSAPAIWFRLPHETIGTVVAKSLYSGISISPWVVLGQSSIPAFDWFSPDNLPVLVDVYSNMDADNMTLGWKLGSYPSWVTVAVRDSGDTRNESTPWYGGLKLKVDTDEDNSGPYRSGSVQILDANDLLQFSLAVYQEGGPATGSCVALAFSFVSSSLTAVTGDGSVTVTFMAVDFSDDGTAKPVWITIIKDGTTEVAYIDGTLNARNDPYEFNQIISLTENVQGGSNYVAYISKVSGHYIPS